MINGKAVDPESYVLQIGDVVKVTCESDAYISATISLLGDSELVSSGYKLKKASAERKITAQDGKMAGYISVQCHSSKKKDPEVNEIDAQYIDIKTATQEQKSTAPKLKKMTVKINGKGVNLNSYVLNVEDVVEVYCEADPFVSASIEKIDGRQYPSYQAKNATAQRIITPKDGKQSGYIEVQCTTAAQKNPSFKEIEVKTIEIKTATQEEKVNNPKVKKMEVTVKSGGSSGTNSKKPVPVRKAN